MGTALPSLGREGGYQLLPQLRGVHTHIGFQLGERFPPLLFLFLRLISGSREGWDWGGTGLDAFAAPGV